MARNENDIGDNTSKEELSPRKRRKRNKQQQLKKPAKNVGNEKSVVHQKKRPPMSPVPTIKVPKVHEPLPNCSICGKPIQAISQAISGPTKDDINHFDCVLRKIEEDEKVVAPKKVSYIGKGTFAIIDTDSEGKLMFTKKIVFESPEHFDIYKKFVEEQKR